MKKDLYLDFDSTIVNSDKSICQLYNEIYKNDAGFIPADWHKHRSWSYEHVCPLIHKHHDNPVKVIQDMYGSEAFFEHLTFYPDAYEVIEKLTEKYKVIICTSAFPMNAARKVLWIEKHLPQVDEIIILIDKSGNGYGKARVAMMEDQAIFIDDHPKNLHSTNATRKYLFKIKETDYNGNWDGPVMTSWRAIEAELL